MTSENEKKPEDQVASVDPAVPPASEGQPGQKPAEASAAMSPEAKMIAGLEAEVADLKDRLLRAHAEMDNVRKRLEREKADQAKFAITKFARDVVVIGDNVQRALDAVPAKAADEDPTLKSFVEGVTMIERELISILGRHGIKRVDPKGEVFNPHQHQAVVEVPSPDAPAGTVTQVFQPGYVIEDRVLRPAMVAVSNGGSKPRPPAEAAPDSTSGSGAAS
ncbi:MAG: nucleotide exchange factor GrpE [Proteobacteria bacterium]|nr:nucleotide exchange factor GrpE [Pseudomonadota bacterium]